VRALADVKTAAAARTVVTTRRLGKQTGKKKGSASRLRTRWGLRWHLQEEASQLGTKAGITSCGHGSVHVQITAHKAGCVLGSTARRHRGTTRGGLTYGLYDQTVKASVKEGSARW
jgi:hypothetical protein